MQELPKRKIRQRTVVEQVMEEFRELISSGHFKPNDRIPSEHDLAAMFGVSRPTIREALKVYSYLGVLKTQTGKVTYVSESSEISNEALTWSILLGDHELREILEMREIIEERSLKILTALYAQEKAAARGKSRTSPPKLAIKVAPDYKLGDAALIVKELDSIVNSMQEGIEKSNPDKLIQADYSFHAALISGSWNKIFAAIYRTLRSFMHEEISLAHHNAKNRFIILREHTKILEGILSGDPQKAILAFQSHTETTHHLLMNANRLKASPLQPGFLIKSRKRPSSLVKRVLLKQLVP